MAVTVWNRFGANTLFLGSGRQNQNQLSHTLNYSSG